MEPGALKENFKGTNFLTVRTNVVLNSAHVHWKSSAEASVVHAFPLEGPGYVTSQGLPPSPELHDPNLHVLWFIPV